MKKLPQMIRSLAFFLSVCMVLSCVYLPGVTVRVSAAEPTVTTIFSENFEDETETLSGWTFQGYNSTAEGFTQTVAVKEANGNAGNKALALYNQAERVNETWYTVYSLPDTFAKGQKVTLTYNVMFSAATAGNATIPTLGSYGGNIKSVGRTADVTAKVITDQGLAFDANVWHTAKWVWDYTGDTLKAQCWWNDQEVTISASLAQINCITMYMNKYTNGKTVWLDNILVTEEVASASVEVQSVAISGEESRTMTVGEEEQLIWTVLPAEATETDVTFTSSDANVVTVDTTGKLTAVGAGTATVTVTTVSGGKTDSITVTVEADAAVLPWEEDFEDGNLEGWRFVDNNQETNAEFFCSVDTLGENHALKLSHATKTEKKNLFAVYDLAADFAKGKKIMLTYDIMLDGTGKNVVIPTFGAGINRLADINTKDFASLGLTQTANTWNTVKWIWDDTGDTLRVQCWWNEQEVAITPKLTSVNSVVMYMSYWAEGTNVWLDNVLVTEEVTAPPQPLPDSYTQDFESVAAGAVPEGMTFSNTAGEQGVAGVVADPENGDNQVAVLGKDSKENGVNFATDIGLIQPLARAVLEYKIKLTDESTLNTLDLRNSADFPVRLIIRYNYLNYQTKNGTNVVNNSICPLPADSWHTIRLVVDMVKNTWYVYVNGDYMPIENAVLRNTSPMTYIYAGSSGGEALPDVYFDDISVTPYVDGTAVTSVQQEITVNANNPEKMELVFTPANTSVTSADFTSSDPSVAVVDKKGYITGLKEGTAVITADPHQDGLPNVTMTVHVTVTDVESVEISHSSLEDGKLTLEVGGHTFITATALPAQASYRDILFTSDNEAVVTVDAYGELVALKAGTATVTATAASNPNAKASITIVVNPTDNNVMKTYTVADTAALQTALADIADINTNRGGMTGNIYIILTGEEYPLTQTLALTEAHGGTNGYSVIWKAGEGMTPVLSGAYCVPSTWQYDAETGIYSVQVGENVNSRQLFVNNVRATRARSQGGLTGADFLLDAANKNIGYTSEDIAYAAFARPQDLEMVFNILWTQPRAGVKDVVDAGNGTVQFLMDDTWVHVYDKGSRSAPSYGPTWIENALELLNEPGEWYLDADANTLYYMPRPWEDMSRVHVTMPILDGELLTVTGSGNDNQVQNIRFEGITFADTTWMKPTYDNVFAVSQNNHIQEGVTTMATGAVVVKHANSVWFTGCTFTRLGITGLILRDGVQNSFITGNRFYDISGTAMNIGDFNTGEGAANAKGSAMMKNNDVISNYIHDIGVDYGAAAAVGVGYVADLDLRHNEIFNVPNSGFHIGWGWNNLFENNLKNLVVENNFVHDYLGQGLEDGGGIYILGNSSGEGYNLVRNNYFRNQMNAYGALYPDQGTNYFRFENNVIDLLEADGWTGGMSPRWLHINISANHLDFVNNYTTTNMQMIHNTAYEIHLEEPHVVPDGNWNEEALGIIAASGLEASWQGLRADQAERIRVEIPETGLNLQEGESSRIRILMTDGKDATVSGGELIVAYDTVDPSVASVSDGVVYGHRTGITKLRIWVVSNGVLTVIRRNVVVGDGLEAVLLEGITDSITMSDKANGKSLTASVVTRMGIVLQPDSVTYKTADKTVATVTEDGFVKPVAKGQTTLTVTATVDGKSVTTLFLVSIRQGEDFAEDNAWEIFDKELEEHWIRPGATGAANWNLVDDTSITAKLSGYMTFDGVKYGNELLSFNLKIDATTGGGGWPSIVLRAQRTDGWVGGGATGYLIGLGRNGIEMYRFDGSTRYVIYGNASGYTGQAIYDYRQGDKILDAFTYENDIGQHDIKVGAIADGDDVHILLIIDGETVIDYVDEAAQGAIAANGYLGFVGRSETWTITKNAQISEVLPAAVIGDTAFATLAEALAAAKEGDTVKLLADAGVDQLVLTSGVKLDLNSYDLTADYIVAFDGNDIVDSASGVGLIKCARVRLAKNNEQMPVWDEAAGGYRLFGMRSSQMFLSQSADKFEFLAKPLPGSSANSVFMSQAETNGLTFKVRMSWTGASGNEVHQDFTLKGEDLKTIYSQANQVVSLKVSGAGSYVNRLQVSCYILSQTGVEWLSAPDLFVGQ